MRRSQGFGPHRIAWALGIARSTAYAVLRRCGLNRLDRLHRVSRRQLRYEHPAPGDLLHIDVKKLGRIPEGGGHRVRGRSAATPRTRGLDYLHVAVDDHSRYAYVAVLPDERGPSCAAFLEQALAAFGRRGVRVRGVLTDNAKAYTVSRDFRGVAAAAGVALRHTRPTARRRTARPSASSRPCRTSGPTPAPIAPTPSGCTSSRAGSTATMLAGHTAVSAGLSPPHACKPESTDRSLRGRAAGLAESSAGVAALAGRCRGRTGARSRRSTPLGGAEGAGARVREACAGMLARASEPAGAVSGRQAGSGSARNRASAAAHWPAQGQRFGRCRVQRRAEWVSRPARAK